MRFYTREKTWFAHSRPIIISQPEAPNTLAMLRLCFGYASVTVQG